MNFLQRFFRAQGFPLALLFASIAAYGLLIPYLGFYWDDWPMIWFAHRLGPSGYSAVFSGDRPFLAGVYILTTSLLKTAPLQWQMLGIITRWLTALALWWTLRNLWRDYSEQTAWIALLFAVYPGFKQQPISVVYSNGFLLLLGYLLSWGCMLVAIRKPSRYWVWTIAGLLAYTLCMFSTEYYVGLDLIRPLLIWLVLGESIQHQRARLTGTLRHWLPYLLVLFAFLAWRVLIFKFPTYQPGLVEDLTIAPTFAGFHLLARLIQDVFTTGWLAWSATFRFPQSQDFQLLSNALYWAVVGICLPLAWLYLAKFRRFPQENPVDSPKAQLRWAPQAMMVGAVALFAAGWPFWITELPITLDFPWERFTLAFMLGSAIFLVGLLVWALRTRAQQVIVMGLLVSMAIGSHFQNANTYRRDWLTQKDFFWQLVWRAPGLQPGTTLITHYLPLNYYSDNSLTAPLNWVYAPDDHSHQMSYYFAYTQVRLGRSIPALKRGLPIQQRYRNVQFEGSTSEALVVFYSPPGCLRILDPQRDGDLPIFPAEIERAMKISNLQQVILNPAQPAQPPSEIFGAPPVSNWCYYFQHAELARQRGDWEKVIANGNRAFEQGLFPAEPSELLVFIEGYAIHGDWEQAINLTRRAYEASSNLRPHLCNISDRLARKQTLDDETGKLIRDTQVTLECPAH